MAPAGLVPSFLAAIQASLSVLLVIFYGILAAHWKLLDSGTGKAISKICVKMFVSHPKSTCPLALCIHAVQILFDAYVLGSRSFIPY